MEPEISSECQSRISAFVTRTTGLYFSQANWPELRRRIIAAVDDLGFAGDSARCIQWLAEAPLLTKCQFESLAIHLTVGETYFFRERRHFNLLTERIIPELVHRGERRIRIWSAGCCTGEEAYSIAIMLRRAIPDLEHWQVTVLATDINPRFLCKAEAGVFGPWSFRDVPEWLKTPYFRATGDGRFEVIPEIKRLVRFAPLNLAEDAYPSVLNDTHAMDVIFCRNVLMYFAPGLARKVVEKMHRVQREGGWLIVGSSELLHLSPSRYVAVSTLGTVVYRKSLAPPTISAPWAPPELVDPIAPPPPLHQTPSSANSASNSPNMRTPVDPRESAEHLYAERRYGDAADLLRDWLSTQPQERADAAVLSLLARCLANQGQLAEALGYCDRSIAADRCNAIHQYLRALILREQGMTDDAMRSLRSALYLAPDFVMAHVALATLTRNHGRSDMTDKHLKHALETLERQPPDSIIPESEGMTATDMIHMIHAAVHEGALR